MTSKIRIISLYLDEYFYVFHREIKLFDINRYSFINTIFFIAYYGIEIIVSNEIKIRRGKDYYYLRNQQLNENHLKLDKCENVVTFGYIITITFKSFSFIYNSR